MPVTTSAHQAWHVCTDGHWCNNGSSANWPCIGQGKFLLNVRINTHAVTVGSTEGPCACSHWYNHGQACIPRCKLYVSVTTYDTNGYCDANLLALNPCIASSQSLSRFLTLQHAIPEPFAQGTKNAQTDAINMLNADKQSKSIVSCHVHCLLS